MEGLEHWDIELGDMDGSLMRGIIGSCLYVGESGEYVVCGWG